MLQHYDGITGKPTFVDTATLQTQCVILIGMKLQSSAGMAEGTGNPGGGKPQDTQITVGKATRNIAFTQYEVKTLFYDGALYELDTMEV